MNATPLAQFLPDAASLINEVVDALRAILRDTSASAETHRRAAATLLHFLVPRPSSRIPKASNRATDSGAAAAEKSMPSPRHEVARDGCQTPHERSSGAGLVTDPSMPLRADGASDARSRADDDESDDPRLTAALDILRLARPDIDFDEDDDDDEPDDQGIEAMGCPGQRASAPASESAGNHQQFPGAVSERCSDTHEANPSRAPDDPVALLALLQQRREEARAIRAQLAASSTGAVSELRADSNEQQAASPARPSQGSEAERAGPIDPTSPGAAADPASGTNETPRPIAPSNTHSGTANRSGPPP